MDISKDKNPVKWFEYEPGERYKLKWFSGYDLKGLKDEAYLNENLINWEGVESDGKPIECNEENKRLFASSYSGQQRLIWMVKKSITTDEWIDLENAKKK